MNQVKDLLAGLRWMMIRASEHRAEVGRGEPTSLPGVACICALRSFAKMHDKQHAYWTGTYPVSRTILWPSALRQKSTNRLAAPVGAPFV